MGGGVPTICVVVLELHVLLLMLGLVACRWGWSPGPTKALRTARTVGAPSRLKQLSRQSRLNILFTVIIERSYNSPYLLEICFFYIGRRLGANDFSSRELLRRSFVYGNDRVIVFQTNMPFSTISLNHKKSHTYTSADTGMELAGHRAKQHTPGVTVVFCKTHIGSKRSFRYRWKTIASRVTGAVPSQPRGNTPYCLYQEALIRGWLGQFTLPLPFRVIELCPGQTLGCGSPDA